MSGKPRKEIMGIAKGPSKNAKTLANRHMHCRISFLYDAAKYLALEGGEIPSTREAISLQTVAVDGDEFGASRVPSAPHRLISHLRSVALKSQIRLSRQIKRSICKNCDAVLVGGESCRVYPENRSKGGKKPWADMVIVQCNACRTAKRFPVGATRQLKKNERPHDILKRSEPTVDLVDAPSEGSVVPPPKSSAGPFRG